MMKPRLTNNTSLSSSGTGRASINNYSFNSSKSVKNPGGIQTSLRKGLPKKSQLTVARSLEDEESIWKGSFNSIDILDYINLNNYIKGTQMSDIEALKKLPGGSIWHLSATTSLENGKTIDVAAIRSKILAEYFKGAENVPEKLVNDLFPNEKDRSYFLTYFNSKMDKWKNEKFNYGDLSSLILDKKAEGEASHISEIKPNRSIFANGEPKEIYLTENFQTRGLKAKSLLLKGEFEDASAAGWTTFGADSDECSLKENRYKLPSEINRKVVAIDDLNSEEKGNTAQGSDLDLISKNNFDEKINIQPRRGSNDKLGKAAQREKGALEQNLNGEEEDYGLYDLKQLVEKKGAGNKSSKDQLSLILKQSMFSSARSVSHGEDWNEQYVVSTVDEIQNAGRHYLGQNAKNSKHRDKFLNDSNDEKSEFASFRVKGELVNESVAKEANNSKNQFAGYGSNLLENRGSTHKNETNQTCQESFIITEELNEDIQSLKGENTEKGSKMSKQSEKPANLQHNSQENRLDINRLNENQAKNSLIHNVDNGVGSKQNNLKQHLEGNHETEMHDENILVEQINSRKILNLKQPTNEKRNLCLGERSTSYSNIEAGSPSKLSAQLECKDNLKAGTQIVNQPTNLENSNGKIKALKKAASKKLSNAKSLVATEENRYSGVIQRLENSAQQDKEGSLETEAKGKKLKAKEEKLSSSAINKMVDENISITAKTPDITLSKDQPDLQEKQAQKRGSLAEISIAAEATEKATDNQKNGKNTSNKQTKEARSPNNLKSFEVQDKRAVPSKMNNLFNQNEETENLGLQDTSSNINPSEEEGVEYEYIYVEYYEDGSEITGTNHQKEPLKSHEKMPATGVNGQSQNSKNSKQNNSATKNSEKITKTNISGKKQSQQQILLKAGQPSLTDNVRTENKDLIRISEPEEVMKSRTSKAQNTSIKMAASPKSLLNLKENNPDKIMEKRTSLVDNLVACEIDVSRDKKIKESAKGKVPNADQVEDRRKLVAHNEAQSPSNEKTKQANSQLHSDNTSQKKRSKPASKELNKSVTAYETKKQEEKLDPNQTQINDDLKTSIKSPAASTIISGDAKADSNQNNLPAKKTLKWQPIGKLLLNTSVSISTQSSPINHIKGSSKDNLAMQRSGANRFDTSEGEKASILNVTAPQIEGKDAGNSKEGNISGSGKLPVELENKVVSSTKGTTKQNLKPGSIDPKDQKHPEVVSKQTANGTAMNEQQPKNKLASVSKTLSKDSNGNGFSSPKNSRTSIKDKLSISISQKNGAVVETLSPKLTSPSSKILASQHSRNVTQIQTNPPSSKNNGGSIKSSLKFENDGAQNSNLKSNDLQQKAFQSMAKKNQDSKDERAENCSRVFTLNESEIQRKYTLVSKSPESRANNKGEVNKQSQINTKTNLNASKSYHINNGYGQVGVSEGALNKTKGSVDMKDKTESSINRSGVVARDSVLSIKQRASIGIKRNAIPKSRVRSNNTKNDESMKLALELSGQISQESEGRKLKNPLQVNKSLDFEARNVSWESNRKLKISEQLKIQEEQSIQECTFSPKINSNTQKILLSPQSALKIKLEKAKKEQEEAEQRKSLTTFKANSATDFSFIQTEDHFLRLSTGPLNNRPDFRTLNQIKVENEFEQRFPGLHVTKCASDVSADLYYRDVIKVLADCTIEERNSVWKEVEAGFLLINSPEEVEKSAIDRFSIGRKRSLSPSTEPSDFHYIKETQFSHRKKQSDRLAIIKSFLEITQKIVSKKKHKAGSHGDSSVRNFDECLSQTRCKSPLLSKNPKDERRQSLGSLDSDLSTSTLSPMVTPIKECTK